MIFSGRHRANTYAKEAAKPIFKLTYMDGIGITEEYWVEDKDGSNPGFTKTLAGYVSELLDSGNFRALERYDHHCVHSA